MLAPSGKSHTLPLQVLMPVPHSPVPEHKAQIGYYAGPDADCDEREDGICYVNLKGWFVDIGNPADERLAGELSLPPGNVTAAARRPVGARELTDDPFSALRARVTLHSGQMDPAVCALGRFEFNGTTVPLANIVTWTMTLPGNTVDLTRRTLNYGPLPPRSSRIATLTSEGSRPIEIFIRHVPTHEHTHTSSGSAAGITMDAGDPVTHYRSFYSLLHPSALSGPLPIYVEKNPRPGNCTWGRNADGTPRIVDPGRNAGTLSCMVASGGFEYP